MKTILISLFITICTLTYSQRLQGEYVKADSVPTLYRLAIIEVLIDSLGNTYVNYTKATNVSTMTILNSTRDFFRNIIEDEFRLENINKSVEKLNRKFKTVTE